MTGEQYSTIYGLIFETKIHALANVELAEYDWQRADALQILAKAEAAKQALHEVWMATGILRGKVPCPECGEYMSFDEPEVAHVA